MRIENSQLKDFIRDAGMVKDGDLDLALKECKTRERN